MVKETDREEPLWNLLREKTDTFRRPVTVKLDKFKVKSFFCSLGAYINVS